MGAKEEVAALVHEGQFVLTKRSACVGTHAFPDALEGLQVRVAELTEGVETRIVLSDDLPLVVAHVVSELRNQSPGEGDVVALVVGLEVVPTEIGRAGQECENANHSRRSLP
ncbi:MAG: hypothetical protein VCC04_08355, partial [Myxococcota bacterium]